MLRFFKILFAIFSSKKKRDMVSELFSDNHYNFFCKSGWSKSFLASESVNNEGRIIPWQNYSFVEFITPRLNKDMRMFEFGSGYSTIYYSQYVKELIAIEHNKSWYNKVNSWIQRDNIDNVALYHNETEPVAQIVNHGKFDIVIVDSLQRHRAIYNSIDCLSDSGVIILDDSERKRYSKIFKKMAKLGFKQLDIGGLSPMISAYKRATIFYRDNNCLKI